MDDEEWDFDVRTGSTIKILVEPPASMNGNGAQSAEIPSAAGHPIEDENDSSDNEISRSTMKAAVLLKRGSEAQTRAMLGNLAEYVVANRPCPRIRPCFAPESASRPFLRGSKWSTAWHKQV